MWVTQINIVFKICWTETDANFGLNLKVNKIYLTLLYKRPKPLTTKNKI